MRIHVDTKLYDPFVPITGGAMYTKPEPVQAIACPNCGNNVTGIESIKPAYLRTLTDEFGKVKQDRAMPPCPVPGFETEIQFCTVSPCGCRVSIAWAGAFSQEWAARNSGKSPKPVVAYTPEALTRENQRLIDALTKLYTMQATAEGQQKIDVDYWVVVVADQIQRLHPGQHNISATPRSLDTAVQHWASKNGHTMPTDPVDPFGLKPTPDDYSDAYPMPPQFKNRSTDQADAVSYAMGLYSMPGMTPPMIPPVHRGTEGAAKIRMPDKPVQLEIPDTVIAQVIGVIDHYNNSDEVVGVLNLMITQGGRTPTGAARLEALSALRRHLVSYQSSGTNLHPNAYYFVTTLLSYVDLSHPGTKAIPVMKPKPAGPKMAAAVIGPQPVDKLARKRRTIRRLNADDQKT